MILPRSVLSEDVVSVVGRGTHLLAAFETAMRQVLRVELFDPIYLIVRYMRFLYESLFAIELKSLALTGCKVVFIGVAFFYSMRTFSRFLNRNLDSLQHYRALILVKKTLKEYREIHRTMQRLITASFLMPSLLFCALWLIEPPQILTDFLMLLVLILIFVIMMQDQTHERAGAPPNQPQQHNRLLEHQKFINAIAIIICYKFY